MHSNPPKNILVAALNWGLGHASRCIPLIKALVSEGFNPIIGSDGMALSLLRKEFPELTSIELPGYNIKYPKQGSHFKRTLLQQSPRFLKTIKAEQKLTKALAQELNLSGIISDNRYGIFHQDIPSVFITHQLKVLSGNTTWMSTLLNQQLIKKFDVCWVPDYPGINNLSGILGHQTIDSIPIKHIGPLSRFEKTTATKTYDLLILLSGPEPQRSILESKLLEVFADSPLSIILVRGLVSDSQSRKTKHGIQLVNYMTSDDLESTINASDIILSRSGYSSIMDLSKLEKKAFFIPTPGQYEQEYLAAHLDRLNIAPSCSQDDFNLEQLNRIAAYKGLSCVPFIHDFKNLFCLFEGKGEFTANP